MMSLQLSLNTWARELGLGRMLYRIYYGPRGYFNKVAKRGFPAYFIDQWHKQQMEAKANQLIPCTGRSGPIYDVHFLTGEKFWQQTCFCFYSLWHQSDLNLRPVLYDDGSLTLQCQNSIRRIFPNARIVSAAEIQQALDQFLPESDYPTLRARRLEYPHLRKLTDIHVGSPGWKLVLDSDMLFFHPPTELLNWLTSPESPCYMVDTETSYGYTPALMESLAEASIPEKINVGIAGLNSSTLNWAELESWCKTLIDQEGTHYCQEQAMIAMLMARESCTVMPQADYLVLPSEKDVLNPTAKLHHYVAGSKAWYFRYGWRHVLAV